MAEATVPLAEQHEVLRRYHLRQLRLPVGERVLRLVVPDAREWLRSGEGGRLASREVGWEPPYWMQVWPAAVAVARAVVRCDLVGRRVLDLGCGLGLPGLAAATRGADVTFVDREADALAFAVWNAEHSERAGAVAQQRIDWSIATAQGTFDVVLLADVSYRPLHHEPLRRHVTACLAPGGVVLHADPLRLESGPFLSWLRENFATTEVIRPTHHAGKCVSVRVCVAAATAADSKAFAAVALRTGRTADPGPSP